MTTERICGKQDCDRPHHAKGFCALHYRHATGRNRPTTYPDTCTLYGCNDPHYGWNLCEIHYRKARYRERKKARGPQRREPNPVINRGPCQWDGCGAEPMGLGRWCLSHFQEYVKEQDLLRRGRMNRPSEPEWGGDWLKRMAS